MDRDAIFDWLLEEDNPPVRLLTLTRLLRRPETDVEVQDARARLMDYSVTQGILAHSDTFWQGGGRDFWSYKGRLWNTVYLGHLLADGHDPRIAGGVQGLLRERGWVRSNCFQCMTACMLAAFRRLGYGEHPIVVEETEALAQRLLDACGFSLTLSDCRWDLLWARLVVLVTIMTIATAGIPLGTLALAAHRQWRRSRWRARRRRLRARRTGR